MDSDSAFDEDDYYHRKEVCSISSVYLNDSVVHLQKINNITIVRDDLLCGGTKSRYVEKILNPNYDNYVYVCSPFGGLQVCLSVVVEQFNQADMGHRRVHIFAERPLNGVSAYQKFAEEMGAIYHWIDGDWNQMELEANQFADSHDNTYIIPNGFDTPEANREISAVATQLRNKIGSYDYVVSVAGSGSLTRGLQDGKLGLNYLAVGVFNGRPNIGAAKFIQYPLEFNQRVFDDQMPPFPSTKHYDAKGWTYAVQLAKQYPQKRILFWNVM